MQKGGAGWENDLSIVPPLWALNIVLPHSVRTLHLLLETRCL